MTVAAKTCNGILGLGFGNKADKDRNGGSWYCYQKQYHLRDTNEFISTVEGISSADISSFYLALKPRTTCGIEICSGQITFPFRPACGSRRNDVGAALSKSRGAGIGLRITKDFENGHGFQLTYGSNVLDRIEVDRLENAEDKISRYRLKITLNYYQN